MNAQELQSAVGDNWHQVQNYVAQEVGTAVAAAGIVALAPLQARVEELSIELVELKASTIQRPETFEEITRLISTLTASAKVLDRRGRASAAFGNLPEDVQEKFGALFEALSTLKDLSTAVEALKAVTVAAEYQPYKDGILALLTGRTL